jgi:hypothetical protein
MKHFLLTAFLLALAADNNLLLSQTGKDSATVLLRIYEDNDFINFYLKGTDNAYTNGTRFDLFYEKKNKPRFFLDRWMPKAGDSSNNTYGWGITQLMYTPDNIATKVYQPGDYPYAGALYVTHTLYSYNARKKFDIQTELLLGMGGPDAFAKETQTFVHHLINYQPPMGWDHQGKNKLLLNINFAAEKQLAAYHNWFELIGGSALSAGTLYNAVSMYPELRIGSMSPYFNSYISHYSKNKKAKNKLQAYLFAKPQATMILYDELLQSKAADTYSKNNGKTTPPGEIASPYHNINSLVYYFSYGAVFNSGHFGISFTQTSNTALLKDLYDHTFGNVTLYFSW